MPLDKSNNPYEIIGNIMITYVEKQKLDPDHWSRYDTIRIQAFKNDDDQPILLGTEIPLTNSETIVEIINALKKLYEYEKKKAKG